MGQSCCGDCGHWYTSDRKGNERWGECGAVEHEPKDLGDAKAFTSDASGYSSSLHCRDDFGCVLFTPKTDAGETETLA